VHRCHVPGADPVVLSGSATKAASGELDADLVPLASFASRASTRREPLGIGSKTQDAADETELFSNSKGAEERIIQQ
jgi:hypothetical protein